jgi:hypothetical protein
VSRNAKKRSRRRTSRRKVPKGLGTGFYLPGRGEIRTTGRPGIDQYLLSGLMPPLARVPRSPWHKAGKASIDYPSIKGGRTSKKRVSRGKPRRKKIYGASWGPRTKQKRRRTSKKLAANRRRSRKRTSRRRSSKRRSRRRASKRRMTRNKKRRSSKRRSSKRRSSRRRRSRRRLTRNMLGTGSVRWSSRGRSSRARATAPLYQLVELGDKSAKKGRHGYPVLVPASVSRRGYVRKWRGPQGAAGRSYTRRTGSKPKLYSKSRYKTKKSSRRKSVKKNRRRSSRRRRTTRRNPKYVVANKRRRSSRRKSSKMAKNRRRRRLRKNQLLKGVDLVKDVAIPVAGGTAGFVAARVVSNGIANFEPLRNILDSGKSAAEAENTKIAANVLGILATLGLAPKVALIKQHQGAIVTGMGLALADRFLGKLTGESAAYLAGMGEYVSQPLGEYVSQPLGEYVSQPLGDTYYAAAGLGSGMGYALGADPADQGGVDHSMDVMEAAAGMGSAAMQAAAGMGQTMYAAAGLGAEADAQLEQYYQKQQPPFASIQTPTDVVRPVTGSMPYSRPVPETVVTPEGRGYAGGLFARHLFAGMF